MNIKLLIEYVLLFTGSFVSMFLLTFGVLIGVLTYAPALRAMTISPAPFYPQLPLSADREDAFFDITKERGKRLFPSLISLDPPLNVAELSSNWIHIPSIDVSVPLVMSASMNDDDVITTLDKGAALYPNNIKPGRLGNSFIAAHSTGEPWKGAYRFAFLRIDELESGDVMHIDYEGTRYTYRIDEKNIIVPTKGYHVISDRPVPTISLMACWPLWSTRERMIIDGTLTNVTQLTPQPV